MTQEEKDLFINGLNDFDSLWLTLYGEFRGESIEAQIAGSNVILNRMNSKYKSVREVCLAPKQFSCWNLDDPNLDKLRNVYYNPTIIDKPIIDQLKWVAQGLLESKIQDNTHRATNYLTTALFMSDKAPSWSKGDARITVIIGKTTFLKLA